MNPSPINAFDLQGLAGLKRDAKAHDPEALKQAAKQFESLFTQMLLKSMREANKSFGDSLFGSDQSEFYEGMFDNQMAVHLSQGKGLGLADMLIRQLSGAPQSAGIARPLANLPQQSVGGELNAAEASLYDGGGQGGGVDVFATKSDFVRTLYPHAQTAAKKLGVDPDALIAQAALETGWGKALPCTADGECSFNLFGIKAGSAWDGATVNVPTLEFEDGVAVRKVERFRAYNSPAESFMDYARLIANSPRYENARGAGADVGSFAAALQEGGYATDPNYASKIVAVAAQVRAMTNGELKVASARPITSGGGVSNGSG